MSLRPSSLAAIALDLLASALAPPRCAACDAPVRRLAALCGACAATAQRASCSDQDVAAYVYGGAVARAIGRMKYEKRPDLARPLGDLLWRAVEPRAAGMPDACVVPVPLHPRRLVERGYNHAALLARRLGGRLGAEVYPVALARTRETPRQATLDRRARLSNVAQAFRAARAGALRGRAVWLVDDVRTTGSTLDACRRALLEAGVTAVATAVVARAE